MHRNIALLLEYDGHLFHGWQSQANANTVQDTVAAAIRRLDGAPGRLTGASRTDAGVHARGQVANFFTDSRIPAEKYAFALNAILPEGVACIKSYEAENHFHARFSAKSKIYSYLILNRRHPSAIHRYRAWHVPLPLNIGAMREAACLFIGEHDFNAFMSAGSPVKSTIRTIMRLDISEYPIDGLCGALPGAAPEGQNAENKSGSYIRLTIEGDGFLYNMARIIAGTLVYAGRGRFVIADIGYALSSGDRRAAGKTAPPHGLCLECVRY
jgi:tRNA pseudouridine38-40 synthase